MKEGQEGMEPSSITECLVLGQLYLGLCLYIFNILSFYFSKTLASNFFFIGYLITVSLLIFGGVWVCKLFVDFVNRKLKVDNLTKYRNDYLIAFGSIGICAVVIEVMVFYVKCSSEFNIVTAHIYVTTTASIYFFFLFPTFDKTCTWITMDEMPPLKYFLTTLFSHAAVLLVSCRLAVDYDKDERGTIVLYQLGGSVVTAITSGECARVWWVGVQLINVQRVRNEVAVQPVQSRKAVDNVSAKPEPEPTGKAVAPKPNCNICSIPYTENGVQTPRQIKECGHTICEECADKLLNVKCQNLLICPFCQKPTIVNGSARTLPKNFALLEYTREVVQRNKDPSKIA